VWACMMIMMLKAFQGENLGGGNFSVWVDIRDVSKEVSWTLIIIYTQIE